MNDRNVRVISVQNLEWLRKAQTTLIVGNPSCPLRDDAVAVFRDPHSREPKTLL